MKIVEMVRSDPEIRRMKAKIKEMTGKNASPFIYKKHGDIDIYKQDLRDTIERLSKSK